jgi:hypothetical protein
MKLFSDLSRRLRCIQKKKRQMEFTNPSKRVDSEINKYGLNGIPKLLRAWNREFQALVTITLSKLHNQGKHLPSWKEQTVGIFKYEGGCAIMGVGSLVLGNRSAYYENGKDSTKANELISKMVVEWDPMNPVETLVRSCGDFLVNEMGVTGESKKVDVYRHLHEDLRDARSQGGPFSADPLRTFFEYTLGDPETLSSYIDHCLIKYEGWTQERVDQKNGDKKLGEELLALMNRKCQIDNGGGYGLSPLCCSPRRFDDGTLNFWINTGRSTQIDGWKTEEQIRDWVKNGGPLVDSWK